MSNKKTTFHIVSIKPGDDISIGKNYEANNLGEAYKMWQDDVDTKDNEFLVAYGHAILSRPLLMASEIEAVELQQTNT